MPIPLAAAGIAAGRRAALSAARKTKSRLAKGERGAVDRREQVSWIEVLLVGGLALLFNDLPDIANITIVAQLVTGPIDIISALIIGFWFWWRTGEKFSKAGIKNGTKLLVELIPFVGIFPTWFLSIINVKLKWFD